MYEVKICNFNDFTKEQQDEWCYSNNGCGKEYASYLVETLDGKIIDVKSDAMEPEDACFGRDLSWIKNALEKAYLLGKYNK